MYLFENMNCEHPNQTIISNHTACEQMGMFDTLGMSEYAQELFAWEADFLSGDIFITDVKTGHETTLSLEQLAENIHDDDLTALRSSVTFISSYERRHINLKLRYYHDGSNRVFVVNGMAFARDDRAFAVGYAYDQSLSGSQFKRLEYLESHDALTGLANAAALDAFVNDFFKFGMYPQTLIVAKIDRFNEINNAFGYNEGNTLIKNVAEVIKECFFDAEMIARIGGGEYCAVYAGKEQLEIDNKIKQASMMLHGMYMNLVKTDVSFGYAAAEETIGFCDLYRHALRKMRKNRAIRTVLTGSTLIDSMNSIIEKKAGWGKRQIRLQSLSTQVAAFLGCNEDCINEIKVLAKIADIGLLSVNDQLIQNKLTLTGNDLDEYMRHVEHGREIISRMDELEEMQDNYIDIFKRYDEWFDAIPLASCIIAAVRGFDDIVSSGAVSLHSIKKHFMLKSGKEYSPKVVEAVLEVAGKLYVIH